MMLCDVLPSSDILDKIISVLITLFILSVITEKMVSLIRKYPLQCQIILIMASGYFCVVAIVSYFSMPSVPWYSGWYYLVFALLFLFIFILTGGIMLVKAFKVPLNDKKSKRSNFAEHINYFFHLGSHGLATMNPLGNLDPCAPKEEKEKEITLLSFLTGVGVAYIFQIDMITMLLTGEALVEPWTQPLLSDVLHFNKELIFTFRTFFGIVTAGFFLSFGSRFFHDLLDNLMQAKDLKRKLNKKEDFQSVEEVEEFIEYSQADAVILAISQNEEVLKNKFPNITFLDDSIAVIDGQRTPVVAIYLDDGNEAGIPAKLPVRFPSGRVSTVPTEIVTEFTVGTITGGGMDGAVSNDNSPGYTGSACCLVKDEDDNTCLVTNCHVMTEGDIDNPQFDIGSSREKVSYKGTTIGAWKYGMMDRQCDLAYIVLDDPDTFKSDHDVDFFSAYREIKKEDLLVLKATAKGNICGTKTNAFIIDVVKSKIAIRYNFGRRITFDEVILVGNTPDKKTCRPVTNSGDSGGSVYDDQDQLIGMITGKNDRFSFVLPIKKIASTLNLKLA